MFLSLPIISSSPFIRGSISGLFVVSLLQPFDVVKTVQQGSSSQISIREAVLEVISRDGPKGLWLRGLGPTLARGALGPGTYFQVIHMTNSFAGDYPSKGWDFVQGALARGFGAIVVSPLSVLKARSEWRGSTVQFRLKDMFLGLAPTLLRDVPFSGIYVVLYRAFKPQSGGGPMGDFLAGLASGLLSTLVTHPFDVIKTRAQIGRGWETRELFSGLSLRLLKRPLSTALTWAFYEGLCRLNI